ncbi:hypothetical protein [uncultured Psychroserpens sp.]|uniref:hypothetical protein n=1 Tax=uncultured Psychroserpens sp. TaxID=255436 RepID=UPI00262EE682|nr:hypothetical protein [uncultured Psychroserpens sp.]
MTKENDTTQMKAVEIFMIRKSFARNSSEAIRKEAEDLVNEKHYQGYRLINVDFDVADNTGYIYAYITMKRPNTY